MQRALFLLAIVFFFSCTARGDLEEKEADSKVTETQHVRVAKASPDSKDKRSQAANKLMLVPPMSLMLAVPHPSGRFLMLFPTSSQIVPVMPTTPYINNDHPAMFAARHQLLYGESPIYHPQRQQPRDYNHHHQQLLSNGYLRRLPVDVV